MVLPLGAQDRAGASPGAFSGVASWYGEGYGGKPTASGERYDPDGFSAAHRDLPFGTILRVTSLDTGASVVVRVNDRGPSAKDRVLVLSGAAARVLGMVASGSARVECRPVPPEEAASFGSLRPQDKASAADPSVKAGAAAGGQGASPVRSCRIVVVSFRDERSAAAAVERLRLSGLEAVVEREGGLRRVVMEGLDPARAEAVAGRLKTLGYVDLVITWQDR